MVKRIFTAAALLLLLTSRAQAATINLLLTTNYNEPLYAHPPEIAFSYNFFESPNNAWPSYFPTPPSLASGYLNLLPGVTQLNISLEAESLDNLYFAAYGEYLSPLHPSFSRPGEWVYLTSRYAAQPPSGRVDDGTVNSYGPPWISLANLGAGFSGEFYYFYGYDRGPIGTYSLAPAFAAAPDPLTPVPEPASMLLLGSGLAAIAAKKYRQRKSDVQQREL